MLSLRQRLECGLYGFTSLKSCVLDYVARQEGWSLCLVGAAGCGKSLFVQLVADALRRPLISIDLAGQSESSYLVGKPSCAGVLGRQLDLCGAHPVVLFEQVDRFACGEGTTLLPLLVQIVERRYFFDEHRKADKFLSQASLFFTAQDVEQVPEMLLQRVALQQLPSYARRDKINVARLHLIPQLLARYHVPQLMFDMEDSIWETLIDHYTNEVGVHQLKIRLEQLLLHLLRQFPHQKNLRAEPNQFFPLFGAPMVQEYTPREPIEAGVVFGVAWSEDGGCLLPIEVALLAGEGNLHTTGKLGETLKESIQVALAVAKNLAQHRGYDSDFFSGKDIHLHFPESSTPKDGPSAGLSILVALLSAIFQQPVSPRWSLTGELTLKGHILSIGGLREKLFALHQHHFTDFFVPEGNQPDYQEIGDDAPATPQVHFVSSVQQCLAHFFPEPVSCPTS